MSKMHLLNVFLALVICGCSSEQLKRSTYEAIYQKECLDRTSTQNCDPQHQTYDAYQRERQEDKKSAQ